MNRPFLFVELVAQELWPALRERISFYSFQVTFWVTYSS